MYIEIALSILVFLSNYNNDSRSILEMSHQKLDKKVRKWKFLSNQKILLHLRKFSTKKKGELKFKKQAFSVSVSDHKISGKKLGKSNI